MFVFIVSTVSQLGDILISYFKRLSNIKDTGKIIPGHGGLLDRVDGMIFAFPISFIIFSVSGFRYLMKKIAILGSTGSIGKTLLNIVKKDKKNFKVELLTAKNYKKILEKVKIIMLKIL